MGAFGAPWVAGEALGAGLVSSLPAGNAMTPSGGFVAMGGATPTIMSPTGPHPHPRSTRSIRLHAAHGSGWAWRRVSPLLGAFRAESGLLSKPLKPCVTNGPTRLETGGFGIWYPTAATPTPTIRVTYNLNSLLQYNLTLDKAAASASGQPADVVAL